MAVPTTIFIDTSILDGCSYNFEAAAVHPIIGVAKDRHISLLLPNVTEREMRRHIEARSDDAVKTLRTAQGRAPFLKKWKDWPLRSGHKIFLPTTLKRIATKELDCFLSSLNVVKLDLSGVKLEEVMNWYERGTAPFGSGRKKSEFPDAVALACLLDYSHKHTEPVAVVSADEDFRNACGVHSCLFYYKSLGSYVESLLLSDEHVQQVKSILEAESEMIADGIQEDFGNLGFYADDDEGAELYDPEATNVEFTDLSLIAVGEREASVSFEAEVEFTIGVHVRSYDWRDDDAIRNVTRYAIVTGTAKLTINKEWSEFESVELLELDELDVSVRTAEDEW